MSNIIINKKRVLDIIPRIREAMRKKRMEVRHIAEKTGLKRYTVTNVLMGETKRFDYISLIAAALELPIAIDNNDQIILDFSFYSIASETCLDILNTLNKDCAKYKVEELIFNTYLYAKKVNIKDKKILKGYVYATIEKEDDLFN